MGGEHYRDELLLPLLLESFVQYYPQQESSGLVYLQIGYHILCSLADSFIGFEDLMIIQELFIPFYITPKLWIYSIQPRTILLQPPNWSCNMFLYKTHHQKFQLLTTVDYKIRLILKLGYKFFSISQHK